MNSSQSPLVTVVMPTFNHEEFVREAVDSVLRQQSEVPFRLLVHDDASTDSTADILRKLESANPGRMTVIIAPENRHSQGRSIIWELLKHVDSKYVAFCEGDDFWADPQKLNKQFAFMETNEWCSISHHDVSVVNQTGQTAFAEPVEQMLAEDWRKAERVAGTTLAHGNFIMTCSVMARRSTIRDAVVSTCGGFWPEDFIVFSAACEGGDIGFVPNCEANYRLHGSNSWALLDESAKSATYTRAYYFLAAHLTGRMEQAARSALLERLLAAPLDTMPPSLAKYAIHVDQLEAGMQQIRVDIAGARLERQAAEEESARSRQANAKLRADIKKLKSKLNGMSSSTSWKVTAPVRRVTGGVKRRTSKRVGTK